MAEDHSLVLATRFGASYSCRMPKTSLSILAVALLSTLPVQAGENTNFASIDLEGVTFQSGKSAKGSSGDDKIGASVLYQYVITGTVTGSGSFSLLVPPGTDLAEALDIIQPGFSEELTGTIVNPSGKLPVVVASKKLKGSFDEGPIHVSAKATIQAGLKASGQASFALTGVSFKVAGLPVATDGKITFDAGSRCDILIPEGSGASSRSDLVIFSGKEDAIGNNVYTEDGENQTLVRSLKKNESYSFNILVQNDGSEDDSIAVTGPKGDENVSITYKLGQKNVTKQVTGDESNLGLSLKTLAGKVLKVTVKAKKKDATFSGLIEARGSDNSSDAVRVIIGAL
jgi:hypothetical protein